MNKFAKFFVVFAMALCLMAMPAFAATSMSNVSEIAEAVDEDGEEVEITVSESTGTALLTEVIAADVIEDVESVENVEASELTVLWQKDLHAETLPVTITFHVAGTAGLPLYVYHYNGTSWDLIATGTGEDITATFDSLSPVGIVVKKPIGNNNTGNNGSTSDKTGTTNTSAIALAIALAAGAAAVVTYRKKVND